MSIQAGCHSVEPHAEHRPNAATRSACSRNAAACVANPALPILIRAARSIRRTFPALGAFNFRSASLTNHRVPQRSQTLPVSDIPPPLSSTPPHVVEEGIGTEGSELTSRNRDEHRTNKEWQADNGQAPQATASPTPYAVASSNATRPVSAWAARTMRADAPPPPHKPTTSSPQPEAAPTTRATAKPSATPATKPRHKPKHKQHNHTPTATDPNVHTPDSRGWGDPRVPHPPHHRSA